MKLDLVSRIAAACLVSIGVLAGMAAVAGPAWAAGPTHLCEDAGPIACIYASGPNHAEMAAPNTPGLTNWTYPDFNGPGTSIKQANVNLCLQLDWVGLTNAPVIGASCVNDQAETWTNVFDNNLKRTLFESTWTVNNGHGTYCLLGGPGGGSGLFAEPCSSSTTVENFGWGTS